MTRAGRLREWLQGELRLYYDVFDELLKETGHGSLNFISKYHIVIN